jgi:hypothetical protein
MGRTIDQEHRLLDPLFVLEFTKKQQRKLRLPRLKQPYVKNLFVVGSTAAYSQWRWSVT